MTTKNRTLVDRPLSQDLIVLIHGLAGNSLWMLPMKRWLQRQGYRCVTWSYPSFTDSISAHGERLRHFLATELAHEQRVHLVAHSMGTIVVRTALATLPPQNLGRVVFLAPPNAGTKMARLVSSVGGSFFRTIADLSSQKDSFVNGLPVWNGNELGVIAAHYDWLVGHKSTFLTNQTDHVMVKTTHAGLLLSKKASQLTLHFLQCGQFNPVKSVASSGTECSTDDDHRRLPVTVTMSDSASD